MTALDVAGAKPFRVRLSRQKGWRLPPNTVKVDRTTPWGNPFKLEGWQGAFQAVAMVGRGDRAGMRAAAVELFKQVITGHARRLRRDRRSALQKEMYTVRTARPMPRAEDVRRELRGKNLACWCPLDEPCHADVLLEIANAG